MHAHARAENDFTRNVGRFRHLDDLAEHQLFDDTGGDFAARQHLPHHHLAKIDSRYTVKRGRLTRERRTQPADDRNAVTVSGDKR